ncbi:jg27283, partial [Pararge aegeria aegeria]
MTQSPDDELEHRGALV